VREGGRGKGGKKEGQDNKAIVGVGGIALSMDEN